MSEEEKIEQPEETKEKKEEVDAIPNIPEFYILGKPIKLDIGILYPTKVKDYPTFAGFVGLLCNTDDTLYRAFVKQFEKPTQKFIIKTFETRSFFELLHLLKTDDNITDEKLEYFSHLKEHNPMDVYYLQLQILFLMCFKEDVFGKIKTKEEFEQYLEVIRNVNGIEYRKPKKNAIFEAYTQADEKLDNKGIQISFEGKLTSVWLELGQEPLELTLYQLNKLFVRLSKFKEYDLTSLYSLLASDVKPTGWYEDVKEKKDKLMRVSKGEIASKDAL